MRRARLGESADCGQKIYLVTLHKGAKQTERCQTIFEQNKKPGNDPAFVFAVILQVAAEARCRFLRSQFLCREPKRIRRRRKEKSWACDPALCLWRWPAISATPRQEVRPSGLPISPRTLFDEYGCAIIRPPQKKGGPLKPASLEPQGKSVNLPGPQIHNAHNDGNTNVIMGVTLTTL
jgi:hypothetical protein